MKNKIKKIYNIIVAISGGVDSSVAAWILIKLGYKIKCVFIKCWENNNSLYKCNIKKDYLDSKKVCKYLKIKLIKIDFSYEYWKKVFKKFLNEQKKAKTYNPDILCNTKIKFKLFLKFAIKNLKGDLIATGHYVRKKRKKNFFLLLKGKDKKKDQSYFLCNLKQKQIKKCIFPLGNYTKKQVREIANNINLINAKKKDSMGICFINPKNFNNFIQQYIKNKPGKILDTNKKLLGKHKGLFYYTIGQRKNLNIGGGYNPPYYVAKKKIKKNLLILAQGKNNKNLFSKGFFTKKINFILKIKIKRKLTYKIKIRSQHKETKCSIVYIRNKKIKILFHKPVFAVTPGQSAAFYKKNICLGGAIIEKTIK